jgi:dsDNA-specific endonuclease/ATPase MutS2
MDNTTLEKLHYYELKEIVKGYCASGLGKALIDKLEPSTNIKVVNRRLDETSEGRALLDASYHIPFDGIFNVNSLIEKMEKGASLEPEDLSMMENFLRGCRKLKLFMNDKEGYAPTLSSYSLNITELSYIEEEINISISGNRVASNASKELKKIRKQINVCEGQIKGKLEKFLKNPVNKEYIQEFFVSQRNGKYTIPIKATFKNQVQGEIVETSLKGSTIFVEPDVVARYTSELATLKVEESMEEYKILATLTEMLYEKIKEIKINIDVIAEYDMIWAKSKYSSDIEGIKPKLNEHGYIKIIKGGYPLIKNGVPLDFEIGKDYRSLIITGPNAGGKTIVLKTLGMLNLAVQSGFHIKAKEGTEPNEGAALAIAILEEVYHKGCITVATTHYGEIKNFSEQHPDFENAAMEFRKDTLDPLYKLNIGKTGESNALYISKKITKD